MKLLASWKVTGDAPGAKSIVVQAAPIIDQSCGGVIQTWYIAAGKLLAHVHRTLPVDTALRVLCTGKEIRRCCESRSPTRSR